MSAQYVAVQWNRHKRIYDGVVAGAVTAFLAVFTGLTMWRFPHVTAEIALMRAFGTAAFVSLHVVLCIGPLCRLNRVFLPLLYNRRHLGVATALLGLAHAALVVMTYHAGSNIHPLVSVFVSDTGFPFQAFGFFALVVLLLMAATSHDFWLANLSAPVWKALHMLVYVAYAALVIHVAGGVLQAETNPWLTGAVGVGMGVVLSLHVAAAQCERGTDRPGSEIKNVKSENETEGFIFACRVDEIPEKRARIVCVAGERVAIFRYDGKVSAVSNVCRHQAGPLGEGKIVDGCITCPWHGYQYLPESGASPPPFQEKVATFNVQVRDGAVFISPRANPPGTPTEPAKVPANAEPVCAV